MEGRERVEGTGVRKKEQKNKSHKINNASLLPQWEKSLVLHQFRDICSRHQGKLKSI